MKRPNPDDIVPPSRDERLDELAEILARGVVRMASRKTGRNCGMGLDLPAETRLSVSHARDGQTCEVT